MADSWFRPLFGRSKSEEYKKKPKSFLSDVDVNAGSDLSEYWNKNFQEIHAANTENAKIGSNIVNLIESLSRHYSRQLASVNAFSKEIESLPEIVSTLDKTIDNVDRLSKLCKDVSFILEELEDKYENLELFNSMKLQEEQLELYRLQKQRDLSNYKIDLARRHAERIAAFEEKSMEESFAKQKIYGEKFRADIDSYKQKRSESPGDDFPSRKNSDAREVSDLSSISVEHSQSDKRQFETFLEDNDIERQESSGVKMKGSTESDSKTVPITGGDVSDSEA